MRATATCPVCIEEQIKEGKEPVPNLTEGELDDIGYIHVECPKGHAGIVVYDARRYQVLIRSAARAFADGHTNEVVAVMSTALERAYEFYIRVSCRAKGLNPDQVNEAWKSVSAQSERQFGGFHLLHFIDSGDDFAPDPLIAEVRNKVVHKGKIVREEETLKFAEKVFSRIAEIETFMQEKFGSHVEDEAKHEVSVQVSSVPKGVSHVTLKAMTVMVDLKTNTVIGPAKSFLEQVGSIIQDRQRRRGK